MRFPHSRFILASLLLILTACGGLPVEKVPLEQPNLPAEYAQPSPIGFNKIVFSLPTGTPTVSSSPKGIFGIVLCDLPYGLISQGSLRGRSFPTDGYQEIFAQILEGQGYDVTGNPGLLFDEAADRERAIYSIGGRITDIKADTCHRTGFWGLNQGRTGEGHIEVEWSVYDLLNRKLVYKKTIKGYGEIKTPNLEGVELLVEEAFAASIHNLGADKEFYDLIYYGELPNFVPETVQDPYEQPLNHFSPLEKVVINNNPSQILAEGRFEDIAKSVVMIQKAGHGSGFFISDKGHIITNAHVVGNADRMRIVLSGKEENLVAEVLRVDRKRDVALLKLQDIPMGYKPKPLPVSLGKAVIGSDVYALGAPTYTRLQDTLTKGIISAHRFDRYKKQPLIQADVTTHGGNSGGPLIDKFGNVIGITVSGYIDNSGTLAGLNNFIPIGDALEKLDIIIENDPQELDFKTLD